MRIQVTQQDIDNGTRREGDSCPIALACSRLGLEVDVHNTSIEIADKLHRLPHEAIRFVSNFDDGNDVLPFEFEVAL